MYARPAHRRPRCTLGISVGLQYPAMSSVQYTVYVLYSRYRGIHEPLDLSLLYNVQYRLYTVQSNPVYACATPFTLRYLGVLFTVYFRLLDNCSRTECDSYAELIYSKLDTINTHTTSTGDVE